MFMITFADVHL